MPLSLNEIRRRAFEFAKEWADESSEDAEAKSFWDGFFNVFGVHRRRVATFETPVTRATGEGGFIDLLWRGVLLVEHKSRGKDLDRARGQAFNYFSGLKDRDLPRFVIVSDFARIRLYDLDPPPEGAAALPLFQGSRGADREGAANNYVEFALADLAQNIHLFGFLSGYEARVFGVEDPVNVEAAERLGRLHRLLEASGYGGHELEVFLVRTLFCLFADDTGIFERGAFRQFVEHRTAEDGSDTGMWLNKLFEVLNQPEDRRAKALDEQLAAFPYVNGALFAERLAPPDFDAAMRERLMEAVVLDWSRINPSIFGALFQSIMDKTERRNLGAHYTSEANILKALRPLFLDALRAEFEAAKGNARRLRELHRRLGEVRIFDPAAGCGNFLVIAYRELRLLEIDILRELLRRETLNLDVLSLVRLDVDQFVGIEIEEWPAQIAVVALWLMDHLMNVAVSNEFGQYYARLPLRKAPKIVHGNALRLDWRDVVDPSDSLLIASNPPFVGKHYRKPGQTDDLRHAMRGFKNVGDVDYVAGWFWKAAEFAEGTKVRVALVATNSVTQGEQVPVLWPALFGRFGVKIHFAHRTFRWESEAPGRANVHVVVVGFGTFDVAEKTIFDHAAGGAAAVVSKVPNISPYLAAGPDAVVAKRSKPLAAVPEMRCGSKPSDGGHLVLSDAERRELLLAEPGAEKWVRPYGGADEFLNGGTRWCLWLDGIGPSDLRALPRVKARVEAVRRFREASSAAPTRKAAATPTRFFFVSQPSEDYLMVPEVSSERRPYVPIGLMPKEFITSNKGYVIPGQDLYLFGVLSSDMHMSWMRQVAGRLKSDYQYSASMVFNTFPFPEPKAAQRKAVEDASKAVLKAREGFPLSTVADLYDPVTMPPALAKAHVALDRAVDAAYGKRMFASEAERVAFLLDRYLGALGPLAPAAKPKRARQSRRVLESI